MNTKTLTIPVNGIYFDQIKAGTKTEEYRLVTPFWTRRLVGRAYDFVVMTRGYPPAGDETRRLTIPWRGFTRKTITHPHFGADPVEVYAIDVSASPVKCAFCRNGFLGNRYGEDVECVNGVLIDIDVYTEGWERDTLYPVAPCHPAWKKQAAGKDFDNDSLERLEATLDEEPDSRAAITPTPDTTTAEVAPMTAGQVPGRNLENDGGAS